jgi:DNA-binding CsgD family transcriptional regulator
LAVFADGFDLDAASAVYAPPPKAAGADPLHVLGRLVDQSLVHAHTQSEFPRYRMLEPIRQYALHRLMVAGEWELVRGRHAAYFLQLAEHGEQELKGPDEVDWADRLAREHGNLRAALRRCLDAGEADTALRLACALWQFWRLRGHRNEGARWLEEGLARGAACPPALRARALQQSAELAYAQSDYHRAQARLEEALALCRELGDAAGVATALSRRGRLLGRLAKLPDDYDQAEAALAESLARFRQLGDTSGSGWALLYLGQNALERADLGRAAETLTEAAAVFEGRGERHMRAHALDPLGRVCLHAGQVDRAERLFTESVEVSRLVGCNEGLASGLYGLARVARQRGDCARAAELCAEALRLFQQLALDVDVAACLDVLAGLVLAKQPEHAVRLLAAADALRKRLGGDIPPVDRPDRDHHLAAARAALGVTRFTEAWAAGLGLGADQAVDDAVPTVEPALTESARSAPLSPRQREVAALVARGFTNRQIASMLVIAEGTAERHLANIMAKLGVGSRAQIAAWAAERGLATIGPTPPHPPA